MIKVKVCGMNDPENVKAVSGIKPDYLGYIFYNRSPRFVGMNPDNLIFQSAGSDIKKVGVFVNEDSKTILETAKITGIETIQLHGNESIEICRLLRKKGLTVIKAFCLDNSFDFASLNPYLDEVDYLLFDTRDSKYGGSGRKFNWNKLFEYEGYKPFFLSGGICPEDSEILKSFNHKSLYGVDINSKFEDTPGIKNIQKVESFINSLKSDDKS